MAELESSVRALILALGRNVSAPPDVRLLRVVISGCRQQQSQPNTRLQFLVAQLLEGVASGVWPLEDRLLASSALCAALLTATLPHEAGRVLHQCLTTDTAPQQVSLGSGSGIVAKLAVASPAEFHLCLCHGALQCRAGAWPAEPMGAAFSALLRESRRYGGRTALALRTLARWLTSGQTDPQQAQAVLELVTSSWESPEPGVRKENLKLLEALVDGAMTAGHLLPTTLRDTSWRSKGKFLTLSVLLPRYGVVTALSDFPELAGALVATVHSPHLVSAGCDAYRACLKHIQRQEQWSCFFLQPVLDVLAGDHASQVGQQNLLSRWVGPTLASLPGVLDELAGPLLSVEAGHACSLLPAVGLLHAARRQGLIVDLWQGSWARVLRPAIRHADEAVRGHAFAAVCTARGLSAPTRREMDAVLLFLAENATADSPTLRQDVLRSFVTFLLRLRDASLRDLKTYPTTGDLDRTMGFLESLHDFCMTNLKSGTNYQRKILSLRLFQEVLRYFDDGDEAAVDADRRVGARRKGSAQGSRVKEWAMRCGRWAFQSEESRERLVGCLLEPSDDVRDVAGAVLSAHFSGSGPAERTERLLERALELCCGGPWYAAESGAAMVEAAAGMATDPGHLASRLVDPGAPRCRAGAASRPRHSDVAARAEAPVRLYDFFSREEQPLEEEDDLALFCPAARRLLAGLRVPRPRAVSRHLRYTPGTFEGLHLAKDSGLPETFEGLTVIDPTTGEVGQPLNFPRPAPRPRSEHVTVEDLGPDEDQQNIWSDSYNSWSGSTPGPPGLVVVDLNDGDPEEHWLKPAPWDDLDCSRSRSAPRNFASNEVQRPGSTLQRLDDSSTLVTSTHGNWNSKWPVHSRNVSTQHTTPSENQDQIQQHLINSSGARGRRTFQRRRRGRRRGLRNLNLNLSPKCDVTTDRSSAVSPAPSLDWDAGGDPAPMPEEGGWSWGTLDGGEAEWWEMSSPAGLVGLVLARGWARWRARNSGTPLHGVLSALARLLARGCVATLDELRETVALIEDVVQHTLKFLASRTSKSSVAPSFAEMSQAIEDTIRLPLSTNISPAHQRLLNCVWLNLKACCSLGVAVARCPSSPPELVERCQQATVQVLWRCRHKGAIEAAGESLEALTRVTTTPGETRDVAKLPGQLLAHSLDRLRHSKISTTRRSAGLAILVHRVVSGDRQPGRPLLELAASRLLSLARSPLPSGAEQLKCDLPQAQALHLLTTLVSDSALRQDVAPYVSDAALLCFDSFGSNVWAVRNGALQLFGALVPRLVGEEAHCSVTLTDLLAHHRRLGDHLLETLRTEGPGLVPALALLSRLNGCGSDHEVTHDFSVALLELFPAATSFHVRSSAARTLARIASPESAAIVFKTTLNILTNDGPSNENEIQGLLLLIKCLKERLADEWPDCQGDVRRLLDMPLLPTASWLNKALVAELCGVGLVSRGSEGNARPSLLLRQVLYTLELQEASKLPAPGIHHWALVEADFILRGCREDELCDLWDTAYHSGWDELALQCLSVYEGRLATDRDMAAERKEELFKSLLAVALGVHWHRSYELRYGLYRLLQTLVALHGAGRRLDTVTLRVMQLRMLEKRSGPGSEETALCRSAAVSLACSLLAAQPDDALRHLGSQLCQAAVVVSERTDPGRYDETCRRDVATAFVHLYPTLRRAFCLQAWETQELAESAGVALLDAGTALLVDEDTEVRREAAGFCSSSLHPYACLELLLSPPCLRELLTTPQAVLYLATRVADLRPFLRTVLDATSGDTGPFDHGTSNAYADYSSLTRLQGDSLLAMLPDGDHNTGQQLDTLLSVPNITDTLNTLLSCAYHGRSTGLTNPSARVALHVVDEKLGYVLKVKQTLDPAGATTLQQVVHVYQEHLKEL